MAEVSARERLRALLQFCGIDPEHHTSWPENFVYQNPDGSWPERPNVDGPVVWQMIVPRSPMPPATTGDECLDLR